MILTPYILYKILFIIIIKGWKFTWMIVVRNILMFVDIFQTTNNKYVDPLICTSLVPFTDLKNWKLPLSSLLDKLSSRFYLQVKINSFVLNCHAFNLLYIYFPLSFWSFFPSLDKWVSNFSLHQNKRDYYF